MTLDGFGPLQLPRREAPEVQVVRLLSADDSTEIVEVERESAREPRSPPGREHQHTGLQAPTMT